MADKTTASTTTPPRKGKLTDQEKREILAITANGSSRRFAAKCVGCATSTITRLMRRDPEFCAQMNRAECNLESECLAAIRQAGKDPRFWKARAWLLERRNPEQFVLRPPMTYTIPQVADFLSKILIPIGAKLPREAQREMIHQFEQILGQLRQDQASHRDIGPEDELDPADFLSEEDFDQPGGGATPARDSGSDPSVDDSVTQAAEATYDDASADASTQHVEVRGATPVRNSSGSGVTSSSPTRPPEVPPREFSLDDLTDPSPTAGFRIVRDWPEGAIPIIPEDWPDLPRRNPNAGKENPSCGGSASAGDGGKRASNPHPEPR